MISKEYKNCSVGVSINCDKDRVLLQLTNHEDQLRVGLTKEETFDLIERLTIFANRVEKVDRTSKD